jgi:hypothetical protein
MRLACRHLTLAVKVAKLTFLSAQVKRLHTTLGHELPK